MMLPKSEITRPAARECLAPGGPLGSRALPGPVRRSLQLWS